MRQSMENYKQQNLKHKMFWLPNESQIRIYETKANYYLHPMISVGDLQMIKGKETPNLLHVWYGFVFSKIEA